jgi:hypothetical protein
MINPRRLGHLLGRVSRFHSFWPIIKNYAIELLHVEPLRWLKYNRLGKPSWPTQLHKKLSLGARWSAGVSGHRIEQKSLGLGVPNLANDNYIMGT